MRSVKVMFPPHLRWRASVAVVTMLAMLAAVAAADPSVGSPTAEPTTAPSSWIRLDDLAIHSEARRSDPADNDGSGPDSGSWSGSGDDSGSDSGSGEDSGSGDSSSGSDVPSPAPSAAPTSSAPTRVPKAPTRAPSAPGASRAPTPSPDTQTQIRLAMDVLGTSFVSLSQYEKDSLEFNTLRKLCELLNVPFTDATLTGLVEGNSGRRRSFSTTFFANFFEAQVPADTATSQLSGISAETPLVVTFEDDAGQ
jgi:hypothetical protein